MELGKTTIETYRLLKEVYGDECLSSVRVFEWFKSFQDGQEDGDDDPGSPFHVRFFDIHGLVYCH